MSNKDIVVENLAKRYPGGVTAVDGVSFSVQSGQIFGFLGPNGAGKSTTIKILTTLALPSDGMATVGGYDVVHQAGDVRRIAGVALQEIGLDPTMKSLELLTLQGRLFGYNDKQARARAMELVELVKLTDAVDRRVGTYSGGMRRRLDLAASLIATPPVLFLDEPTTGLDPQARHVLWDRLFRLKETGVTLVITTHYMDEAEQLCERLVVMDGGRIVAEGAPAALIREHSTREVVEVRFGSDRNAEVAAQLGDIGERLEVLPDRILIYTDAGEADLQRIVARGFMPVTSLVRRASLEDVFLRLTGRTLADE